MKTTIKNLSNERLESEIANLYFEAAKVAPGVTPVEKGLLASLWEEFDYRYHQGLIDRDSDYIAPKWQEGYYE